MKPSIILLASVASAALSTVAHAQQSPPTMQAPSEEAVGVEDVIVTAQRRSESLQRVPVSVTAVSAETLENRRLNDLSQISRAAPSLQVGLNNTFAVRGVGTTAFAGTIDSSVALALDDVNLGRPLLGGSPFNDVAQVEVLNGPQGLLFGKNASAGLLNVTTVRPKIGIWEGLSDVEVVNRDTPGTDRQAWGAQLRQTLNIPISANSALRLNGLYSYQEPATQFVGTRNPHTDLDLEQWALKAKYLVEPSDALSIYLSADYTQSRGVGGFNDQTFRQLAPGSVNAPALTADGIVASDHNYLTSGDGGLWRDVDTGGAQASVSYTFASGLQLSNILAWRFYDQDQNNDADLTSRDGANRNYTNGHYDQYSNELRLTLPAGERLTGQAGLYLFSSTLDLYNQIGGLNYVPASVARGFPFCVGATAVPGAFPPVCAISNDYFLGSDKDYTLDTRSYAAFAQFTYDLTDRLKITAGGRITKDEVEIDLVQGQARYFVNLGGPRSNIRQTQDVDNFSWKIGPQYQITPNVMAYGYYGRGYKGPGFNDVAPTLTADLAVRPEISNTAEIGVKSSFLDRRVVLNVSAFHTRFEDFQVQSFDPILRTFSVRNAAEVTSQGLEATLLLAPVAGLSVNASLALLDSTFESFPGAQCYPTQTTLGCSSTVGTFDASGLTLPVSPKLTSSIDVRYEFPRQGSVTPFIGFNWYHRSTIHYALNQAPGTIVDPVDIFGANAGVELDNGLRLSVFCKNCSNEHLPTSISTDAGDASARPSPLLSYNQQLGLESVRIVGVAATFRY